MQLVSAGPSLMKSNNRKYPAISSTVAAFILLFTGNASTEETNTAKSADTIRVVSWNVEWFPGKSPDATDAVMQTHAKLVHGELKRIRPDVFLGQEMRDWQSFAELASVVPGMRPVVVSAFANEDSGEYWRQQLGIATSLEVEAAWSEPWKPSEAQPPRGFSCAAVRVPGGTKLILFYSIHLKSNRSKSEEEAIANYRSREESVRQLIDHVIQMESLKFKNQIAGVVIGGDFNTNEDGQFGDKVMKLMEDAGFHTTWEGMEKPQRLTWRGNDRFEPTTFDHIFTRGLGAPKAKLLEVSDDTSDHWPVEVEISIP